MAELYARSSGSSYASWKPDERRPMTPGEWDWTLRVFDHVDLNADVGNSGHGESAALH
jgi:hypothetical protein